MRRVISTRENYKIYCSQECDSFAQWRPMIETEVVLAEKKEKVLIGFSNRSKLTYDMLIGRNLLQLGFLVDVTK